MIWGRLQRWIYEDQPWQWQASRPVPESQGELGEEARKLLDNPVLIEALDRVEKKLIDSWKNSAAGEGLTREEAYRMYWAVGALRVELKLMIANASMSARERQ